MERKNHEVHEEPTELGTASVVTLGNVGLFPEKELTMNTGGISDE
jgi:hypothetical protein